MVRGYKSTVTKQINILRELHKIPKKPVWQRNYYEHVLRNQESFNKISEYIIYNPQKWKEDEFFNIL